MTTPPSQIYMTLDKHLTTLVNCMQNVVYVVMLFHFINTFVSWVGFVATHVSPVESWKGLFYNMWFSALMCAMMLSFKGTFEAIILFENLKRHRDGKKDATTIISMDENSVQMKHVDNGMSSSAWQTVAGYIVHKFSSKAETTEDDLTHNSKDAPTQNEDDAKSATTPSTDDEIKQDAASASSSARSSADTADALH
jgi:hypothetical protein